MSKNIGKALAKDISVFSTIDRAYFLHNSYLIAFSGMSSYEIPALFTNYLFSYETSYLPFYTYVFHMNKLADILENTNQFFEFYVRNILI